MKKTIYHLAALALSGALLSGCSDGFLEPDPQSMYSPENTFTTEQGLIATMGNCDRGLRWFWYNGDYNSTFLTAEMQFSEMGLFGKTDEGNPEDDYDKKLTPLALRGYINNYWNENWLGIKYANTVLTYVDGVSGLDPKVRNTYVGRAYFHRAFRYMLLLFQFGEVPLITQIPSTPKEDYRSTTREAILEKLRVDMEQAVEWVPNQEDMDYVGMVNKDACRQLLAKIYLSLGMYKEAEAQCDIIIERHPLMKNTFGQFVNVSATNTWKITRNVVWDLHRPVNTYAKDNTESILVMPNSTASNHTDWFTMRIFGPQWSMVVDPDGVECCKQYTRKAKEYDETLDWARAAGRGIATCRFSYYSQHGLWTIDGEEDYQDLRHNRKVGNWMCMEDFKVNNPKSKYYGHSLQFRKEGYADVTPELAGNKDALPKDSLRQWFDFPLYALWIEDALNEANPGTADMRGGSKGSDCTWYCYRSAETYLLRAEAKFYQGKDASSDVNALRERADAKKMLQNVTIGDIAQERARELTMEEFRHAELVRISYCLARSGKPDEWGNTYSLDNWDKQEGTDKQGGSYWYQRLMHHSDYNRWGEIVSNGKKFNYTMNKHNMLWPIPNGAITSNRLGQLHQNFGYDGYDPDVPMWNKWEDAVADEAN